MLTGHARPGDRLARFRAARARKSFLGPYVPRVSVTSIGASIWPAGVVERLRGARCVGRPQTRRATAGGSWPTERDRPCRERSRSPLSTRHTFERKSDLRASSEPSTRAFRQGVAASDRASEQRARRLVSVAAILVLALASSAASAMCAIERQARRDRTRRVQAEHGYRKTQAEFAETMQMMRDENGGARIGQAAPGAVARRHGGRGPEPQQLRQPPDLRPPPCRRGLPARPEPGRCRARHRCLAVRLAREYRAGPRRVAADGLSSCAAKSRRRGHVRAVAGQRRGDRLGARAGRRAARPRSDRRADRRHGDPVRPRAGKPAQPRNRRDARRHGRPRRAAEPPARCQRHPQADAGARRARGLPAQRAWCSTSTTSSRSTTASATARATTCSLRSGRRRHDRAARQRLRGPLRRRGVPRPVAGHRPATARSRPPRSFARRSS